MMLESATRYLQRSRELGLLGTLRRVRTRTMDGMVPWSQSLWWGWKARRGLTDAALLTLTTGHWRSLEDLLDHLARRPASSFVLPHDSADETRAILYRDYPDYVSAVLAAADASCRNELSLLGRAFRFPDGIDWQRDPVTGWRWPLMHRSRVGRYLGSARPVDLIVFWELNRHQHFITLGIAFWLTGDQRYVDAFSSQVESWIAANPLQHGVNWYHGLEVSIRIIAWTVAFQFFRGSLLLRQGTAKAFLKSLWQQADFVSNHLQIGSGGVAPNNHLLAQLVGLTLVGAAFPEFRRAAAWRDTSLHLLNQQALTQTHLDGVNREQATGYHRFTAELLLLILARIRHGALPATPVLEQTLERMLDYMLFTSTPDGTAPPWGDCDYGRALGLGLSKDFWDFRPILSAGAALFGRGDWKCAARRFDEEAFWILGPEGLGMWEHVDAHPPQQTSRAFPDAGQYVIRDAWAPDTDVGFLRCGPFGLGGEGNCAHAHCDLLSVALWVNGHPVLVDSGTFMYHGRWRDHFRLTAAHNTARIDGRDQATPLPNFNWKEIPEATCRFWDGTRVVGTLAHSAEVAFHRELIHPRPGLWEVVDTFNGRYEHTLEWFFHFAPSLALDLQEERHTVTVLKDGRVFLIVRIPDGAAQPQLRDSWYSSKYGVKERNRELYAQWRGELHGGVCFPWQFELVTASTP